MESSTAYYMAADAVLLLHAVFAVFIVLGLVLIFAGHVFRWSWVKNPWFRLVHLLAIAIVVFQSWLSVICPLTTLEMSLRNRAGDVTYAGSFLAHWLETVLYYRAAPWVFVVCYSAFGALVVASWFWVRPRRWRP